MEKRILEYEKFIKTAVAEDKIDKSTLHAYHVEMLHNFQHERLIHLLVTLFFAAFAFVLLCLSGLTLATENITNPLVFTPIYLLAALLTVLTGFYIRHYYFLETHIQKLYDLAPLFLKHCRNKNLKSQV